MATVSSYTHTYTNTYNYVYIYFIKYFGLKIILVEIKDKAKADFWHLSN